MSTPEIPPRGYESPREARPSPQKGVPETPNEANPNRGNYGRFRLGLKGPQSKEEGFRFGGAYQEKAARRAASELVVGGIRRQGGYGRRALPPHM